ncbi:MAG TPA: hypothetical protein VII66_02255 [Gemmatimonadaceae bacterium]
MALPSKELPEQALDALITRERTRVVAPLTEWRNLSLSLRQEGLIHDAGSARPKLEREYTAEPGPRGGGWMRTTGRWTMRLAAGAVLVGAGVVAGRGMTFGQDLINQLQLAVSDSSGSHGSVRIGGAPFSSAADARKTLVRAQTDYQRAAAFLAATQSSALITGEPDIYRDRLAGFDELTTASLNALKDAPQDPLLNQYYLSAAAAREATLQQLGNALPVGATMARF